MSAQEADRSPKDSPPDAHGAEEGAPEDAASMAPEAGTPEPQEGASSPQRRRDFANLWMRCPDCSKLIYRRTVEERLWVCPECNFHFEISSWDRVRMLLDPGSFVERFGELKPLDPLDFRALKSYSARLADAQRKTGMWDGCIVGLGAIEDRSVVFGANDSRFLRGSMGSVVGEKICRAVELACERKEPFIFVSAAGGGARMDEGVLSLMQMAKTSAALAELDRQGGLFISVLTNPTMGGAMASYAALGDIIVAEPKALLGFAGRSVIRGTIKSEIPDDFQTSEFLLQHGFVDRIVNRGDLRGTLAYFLRMLVGAR